MSDQEARSIKLGEFSSSQFNVTAASWANSIEGFNYPSYEIGIRDRFNNEFTLLQSDRFSAHTVVGIAKAISILLERDPVEYNPEALRLLFTE